MLNVKLSLNCMINHTDKLKIKKEVILMKVANIKKSKSHETYYTIIFNNQCITPLSRHDAYVTLDNLLEQINKLDFSKRIALLIRANAMYEAEGGYTESNVRVYRVRFSKTSYIIKPLSM